MRLETFKCQIILLLIFLVNVGFIKKSIQDYLKDYKYSVGWIRQGECNADHKSWHSQEDRVE